MPRSNKYDLTSFEAAQRLYDDANPDIVIHLAAEVGGIGINKKRPGRFYYANMAMGLNLIEAGRQKNLGKFVQIGTVCAYPKFTPAPFHERDLWSGFPEETNAPYGVAKRALLTMLQAYRDEYGLNGIYLLPANLYGPGDNFDPETSHVIPALIRKFCEAYDHHQPHVDCWGTGQASREFLHVEDAAEGILAAAEKYDGPEPVNLGTGREITIRALAEMIAGNVGYTGQIRWDASQPDGQPRRQLDVTRAKEAFGWSAKVPLEQGLEQTVKWWRSQSRTNPARSVGPPCPTRT